MADPTLTTSAVGQTRAPPDEAELRFEASAVESDVTGARRAVADRAARLRRVLGETGVPDERVRTTQFRVRRQSPNPHESQQDPESRPFEATETVGVTVRDLDALGTVLTAAVDEADAEIGDVTFTFRTETKRELERKALEDAVETAREKAEAAASAEGLTVGDGPRRDGGRYGERADERSHRRGGDGRSRVRTPEAVTNPSASVFSML